MSDSINFTYGSYIFSPRPLLNISSTPLKTPDGSGYGIMHDIALEGTLILTGLELDSGILGVFDKIEILKDALDHDGKLLKIDCNGTSFISGYPTIESYNFNNASDNYTLRADYSINFKMPTTVLGSGNDVFNSSLFPPFIESCTENWDVEFADERMPFQWTLLDGTVENFGYKLAVTHTVDVKARITYTGHLAQNTVWEDAKTYASGRLGYNSDFVNLSGILNLPDYDMYTNLNVYNNYRRVSTNKSDGSIQVTETFIVTPSGATTLPNNAIETFDINCNQSEGNVTVSINGEIEGLCVLSYEGGANLDFENVYDKFSAASGYFALVKDRMFDRARTAYSGVQDVSCYNSPLNPIVKTRTVGMNPINGTISYSYEYDTSVSYLAGSCIKSQNITIDDALENDVFASQVVLGRATGPILQDIGTITARTRTLNIELVTTPPTGFDTVDAIYAPIPTGEVQNMIDVISGDLSANYSQVFVSQSSQSWNFTTGRYTRTIGFTYNNCDA